MIRGYWDEADRGRPIIIKEIQALRLTLENLLHRSENTRVDVFVDNKALFLVGRVKSQSLQRFLA